MHPRGESKLYTGRGLAFTGQGTLKEEQVSDMEKGPSPNKSQAPVSEETHLMKKSNFFL